MLAVVYRRAEAQIEWEDSRKTGCVEHVRDGKPLTEHGADLLGVPWKED
jgi:hypothetical protein